MKKILSMLLMLVLLVSSVGITASADTNGVKVMLDGELKTLVAYNINGNNYFKLRDIANLLKGTEAEFDVIWNEDIKAIELLSDTPYSTEEELTSEMLVNPIAKSSYVDIYMDGAKVVLGAYNIEGNNYFKLRDVASAINFGVDWNAAESVIEINTDEDYVYPANTSFGLNTQYLSFLGKSKSDIDAMLGSGNYSWEWGMTTYSNGLLVGWNSLGEEPDGSNRAVSMYIPLNLLFFNCPANLSEVQITGLFNSSKTEYNEMDGEKILVVNYCGKALEFYPDYGLTSTSSAFINVVNSYYNPTTESIQIVNVQNKNSAYYEYAKAHDSEFWGINRDWRDDKEYYYLADVDHDGQKEMVVKVGCGVAVYKEVNGKVQEVFYDRLPDSSGAVSYSVVKYDNKDYIAYDSGGSSEYKKLNVLKNGKLDTVRESMTIVYTEFMINGNTVSDTEYYNYVNSIVYSEGMSIDGLK